MKTSADYPTLFDIHPIGTQLPIAQRVITPGCLLPAPEKYFVDMERAAGILAVGKTTVHKLLRAGVLTGHQVGESKPWRVLYDSIVQLCDELRVRHHIADRRTRELRPGQRWRDAELLPFPPADTITIQDAMVGFSATKDIMLNLCEEGRFDAYRLFGNAPWRISKTSLFAYAERQNGAVKNFLARRQPASR